MNSKWASPYYRPNHRGLKPVCWNSRIVLNEIRCFYYPWDSWGLNNFLFICIIRRSASEKKRRTQTLPINLTSNDIVSRRLLRQQDFGKLLKFIVNYLKKKLRSVKKKLYIKYLPQNLTAPRIKYYTFIDESKSRAFIRFWFIIQRLFQEERGKY